MAFVIASGPRASELGVHSRTHSPLPFTVHRPANATSAETRSIATSTPARMSTRGRYYAARRVVKRDGTAVVVAPWPTSYEPSASRLALSAEAVSMKDSASFRLPNTTLKSTCPFVPTMNTALFV